MLTVQQIADSVSVASREYPLRKVELFGSYASGKNTPQSDVDLLVEFAQPRVSLLTISALKFRMEELLGTDVDIIHGPLPEGSMLEVGRRIPLLPDSPHGGCLRNRRDGLSVTERDN